jgi:hypothetical protein
MFKKTKPVAKKCKHEVALAVAMETLRGLSKSIESKSRIRFMAEQALTKIQELKAD